MHLEEELGDLLLQVVFHGELAEEAEYNLDDIARGICDKLVRRHPHSFRWSCQGYHRGAEPLGRDQTRGKRA